MSDRQLPVPPHFAPEQVGEIWRVDYQHRFEEAEEWAARHRLPPSQQDTVRTCLLAVDVQNTFCLPDFELFVAGRSGTGAVDDTRRLCEFIYRNLRSITRIVPTLDTHQSFQIFHSCFLIDRAGGHPPPLSSVTLEDIVAGRWDVSPRACGALGLDEELLRRHILHYAQSLEENAKFDWTVWPFHALLGGIGHALVPAFEEAIFFHSIARSSQPDHQLKGRHPLTEHYSALGPEVRTGPDGEQLMGRNHALIEQLLEYDRIIVAGQAKSHCVAWTLEDILGDPAVREREAASKFYLLEDCTSAVVVPGVVDYSEEADSAFARFERAGVHRVRSTLPLCEWP